MNDQTKNCPSLKDLREAAKLTQPQLSQKMGVGIRIIGDWERGISIPRLDRAVALARALNVSLTSLCESFGIDIEGLPNDDS